MHIRDNTVHDVQVAIGYETFAVSHKHALTLGVLKALLGEWDTHSFSGNFLNYTCAFLLNSVKLKF